VTYRGQRDTDIPRVLTSREVDMFSGYIFDVEGTVVDSVPQKPAQPSGSA